MPGKNGIEMSWEATRKVWDMKLSDHEIKGNDLLVLLYLAFRHSKREDLAWPSWKEIQSSCSMGKTSVHLAITKLERLKVIERINRPQGLAYRLTSGAQLELFPVEDQVQNPNPPGSESEPDEVQNPNLEVQNPNLPIVEDIGEQKKRTVAEAPEELPANLQNPDFVAAWERWQAYRKEAKKKLTPSTAKAQLKKLSEWGAADAIESIEQSIEHGWQGLFEPKGNGTNGTGKQGNFKSIRTPSRSGEGLDRSRDQYANVK